MTRDRILAAAKAILEKEGLAALSMRKIAHRAGMSPMGIYSHFEDKGALINALMLDGLEAWEKIIRSIHAKDPLEWLERMCSAYLDFAVAQPHLFDAAFFLPATKARRYPDDFVAGHSPAIAMAMVRIDQAKADGRLGNKPALDMAFSLTSLAQGIVSMQRANRFSGEKQFRTLYQSAIRHCIDSFKPIGRTA
jgi:AcrR family transcriptional regulator